MQVSDSCIHRCRRAERGAFTAGSPQLYAHRLAPALQRAALIVRVLDHQEAGAGKLLARPRQRGGEAAVRGFQQCPSPW